MKLDKNAIAHHLGVGVPLREALLGAVVARACRCCGAANSQLLPRCAACGTEAVIERLGTVSYWHRNPLRRWAFALRRWLSGLAQSRSRS